MNKHGRFPPGKLILLVLLMVAVTACNGLPGSQSSPTEKPTPPVPAIPKETEIPPILEVTQPIVFPTVTQQQPTATAEPPLPTPTRMVVIVTPTAAAPSVTQPASQTPEEVALAFLNLLKTAPADSIQYLTAGRIAQIPSGDVAAWVALGGVPEGFEIQAASVSPDQGAAVVVAAITVNGMPAIRIFNLLLVESRWLIDSIDFTRG